MALDLDGSWLAWNSPGRTDLKNTWAAMVRAAAQVVPGRSRRLPLRCNPNAGPADERREFTRLTGADKGDFGVVVYRGHWLPTFVADGGPYNKLGEGASSALAGLGVDRCRARNAQGHCTRYLDASIESGVLYILFPRSAPRDMTRANALNLARVEACRRLALPGCP
jgi:hypothetical protein